MTAPHSDDRLQQYFDGELVPEEAESVRRELEDDEELRAKLEGLEHLHAMMSISADEVARDLDSEALFARVLEGIAADVEDDAPMLPGTTTGSRARTAEARAESAATEPRPGLRVVSGGKEGSTPAPAPTGRRVGLWVGVGVTTLAAAAALLFFFRGMGDDGVGPGPDDPDTVAVNEPPPGSEVIDVDFGYSTGAIFSVEGQEGARYAVVWISDEKVDTDADAPPEDEERLQ